MSPEALHALLAEPRVAVISTVDAQGRPHSAPVWYLWAPATEAGEGPAGAPGAAFIFTRRRSMKWQHLQANPYASLCVDHREPPYAAAILQGRVEESDRSLYEAVLAMALAYYGEERGRAFAETYRDPSAAERTVLLRLIPERITSWAYDE